MIARTIAVAFLLLTVSLFLPGCGATQKPKASTGTLRISFAHPGAKHLYEDVVLVDGETVAVGSGRGGVLDLPLTPGEHAIRLYAARLQYFGNPVETEDRLGQCMDRRCNFWLPARRTDFEMKSRELDRCEKQVQVAISAGQTIAVDFVTKDDGKCP